MGSFNPLSNRAFILSINCILQKIPKILHLAQQPKGQLRQPKGAYKKRDHQQDKAVLRGVCRQDGHAQQGNHRTEQPQHQAGHIDQPHANPDGQGEQQDHRRNHNLQNQLQCGHFMASSRRSKYFWHRRRTCSSSASFSSRRPFVS